MLVDDLVNEIASDFINRPPESLIKSKINTVIHIINSLIGKRHELLKITGTEGNWEDLETNWEDLETNWEELGRFTNDFVYNNSEYKLTIPPTIDKVEKLWVDNELWRSREYAVVKDGDLADKIYCQIGSDIFFGGDIGAETSEVRVLANMNYPDIKDGYVTLDFDFRQTLVSGATMMIALTQKHRDADLYMAHKGIYEVQMEKMRSQRNSADSPDIINYGGADKLVDIEKTDDYYLDF